MAITQDGSQLFAIASVTFGDSTDNFIVESFTKNSTSSRVDINNGNGEPLGAVTVPGREEVSLTVQMGAETTVPQIGNVVSYAGVRIVLTEVSLAETQSDYRRYNISGYVATDQSITLSF